MIKIIFWWQTQPLGVTINLIKNKSQILISIKTKQGFNSLATYSRENSSLLMTLMLLLMTRQSPVKSNSNTRRVSGKCLALDDTFFLFVEYQTCTEVLGIAESLTNRIAFLNIYEKTLSSAVMNLQGQQKWSFAFFERWKDRFLSKFSKARRSINSYS